MSNGRSNLRSYDSNGAIVDVYNVLWVGAKDVTVDSCWDAIVAPLIDTPWWESKRLVEDAGAQIMWDSRVAMIDTRSYEGHG